MNSSCISVICNQNPRLMVVDGVQEHTKDSGYDSMAQLWINCLGIMELSCQISVH